MFWRKSSVRGASSFLVSRGQPYFPSGGFIIIPFLTKDPELFYSRLQKKKKKEEDGRGSPAASGGHGRPAR